jgi:hypothetical protein
MRLSTPQVETRSLALAACVFLAVAVFASVLIAPRNALKARGSAPLPIHSLGKRPVLQIELAWSEQDLMKVFQPGDTKANLHDANVGNNLDTFLFIPSYTGLLLTLGLLIARSPRLSAQWPLFIALLLTPAIAICDWGENWGIARAIHHIEVQGKPEAGDALRISTPSLAKWTLTMVVCAVFGMEAFYTRNWKWFPAAVALILLSLGIAFVLCSYARERWG